MMGATSTVCAITMACGVNKRPQGPSGPERDKAWGLTNHEEQSKDPDKKGAAVIIELDLIEQIDSTVIMKKD